VLTLLVLCGNVETNPGPTSYVQDEHRQVRNTTLQRKLTFEKHPEMLPGAGQQKDNIVNKFGKALLSTCICKILQMYFVNGRSKSDSEGHYTFTVFLQLVKVLLITLLCLSCYSPP
jgi:hypothetical protein